MFDPAALEIVLAGKAESGFPNGGICYKCFYSLRRFLGNALIGIQHQNPWLTAFVNRQLFLRPESQPAFFVNFAAKFGGNAS